MNTQLHSTRVQAPTESSSEIDVSTAQGNNDDVPLNPVGRATSDDRNRQSSNH